MGTSDESKGLYRKYSVRKLGDDGKHDGCEFFVLDWRHDKFAVPAMRAYADACEREFPKLAKDLRSNADYYEREHDRPTTPEGSAEG